jgi:asparaginyl-tRNA synthetase
MSSSDPKTVTIRNIADDLSGFAGQSVRLQGWLYNKSSKGKLHFLRLRDGTGLCQCIVMAKNVSEELFAELGSLGQESSLELVGEVALDERAPGGFEVKVTAARVYQNATDYPITPKEHGVDFLHNLRHLWLRSQRQWAIMRVRDGVISALRRFFESRDFVNFDAPMFTPNACEGTSTLFEVGYFDQKAFLTQSGQLYGEAGCFALRNIYTFGPTFRAEKSKTRRHLTEFWMLEPEMAFATLDDVVQLAEDMIVYVVKDVLERRRPELEVLERDLSKLEAITGNFPRLTYDEAAKILADHPESNFVYGDDFGAPDETIISNLHNQPTIITHYPAEVKAFYMKRDGHGKALCVDILGSEGVGEIIGGSQREDSLDLMLERIKEHELPEEAFSWYLDLRRFGSVPHGGFGLGLERFIGWIAGLEHVRETIPFPRMMTRLTP